MVINWDPKLVSWSANSEVLLGVMGLMHEVAHFYNFVSDSAEFMRRSGIGAGTFTDLEEKFVITGIEAAVARDLGYDVRTTHKGLPLNYHSTNMFSRGFDSL